MRDRFSLLAILLTVVTISGCIDTPFATSVSDINFSSPQAPASIQLSDPQVYARETLINDRRKEVAYLNRLIEASETVRFQPQLKRDLQTLTAFAAQLQATVDPALGASFQRDEGLRELQFQQQRLDAEAALVRSRSTLLEEQRKYDALLSGPAPAPAPSPAPAPQPPATQPRQRLPRRRPLILANRPEAHLKPSPLPLRAKNRSKI